MQIEYTEGFYKIFFGYDKVPSGYAINEQAGFGKF